MKHPHRPFDPHHCQKGVLTRREQVPMAFDMPSAGYCSLSALGSPARTLADLAASKASLSARIRGVRVGSQAAITLGPNHVRFTPASRPTGGPCGLRQGGQQAIRPADKSALSQRPTFRIKKASRRRAVPIGPAAPPCRVRPSHLWRRGDRSGDRLRVLREASSGAHA